jgi:hypothetical protein
MAEGFFFNNDPANPRNPLQEIRFNSETWNLAKIVEMTPNAGVLSVSGSSVQSLAAVDERRSNHGEARETGDLTSPEQMRLSLLEGESPRGGMAGAICRTNASRATRCGTTANRSRRPATRGHPASVSSLPRLRIRLSTR